MNINGRSFYFYIMLEHQLKITAFWILLWSSSSLFAQNAIVQQKNASLKLESIKGHQAKNIVFIFIDNKENIF